MRFPSETIRANLVGLDLGQRRDHTAIAVIAWTNLILGRDPVDYNFVRRTEYRIVHLERVPLGSPYSGLPAVLHDVIDLARPTGDVTLAIDATGPGMPVVDMIRNAGLGASLLPAVITGGGASSRKPTGGVYSIARKELLSILRVAIETGRLKAAQDLDMRDDLLAELRTLEPVSRSGPPPSVTIRPSTPHDPRPQAPNPNLSRHAAGFPPGSIKSRGLRPTCGSTNAFS